MTCSNRHDSPHNKSSSDPNGNSAMTQKPLPWWASGYDSILQTQGLGVQFMVMTLDPTRHN